MNNVRRLAVPDEAWSAKATDIPTRIAYDWEALYAVLEQQGWIVMEAGTDDLRTMSNGAVESKNFKDFRNYAMNNKGFMLNARRVGLNRWYVVIGNPYKRTKGAMTK